MNEDGQPIDSGHSDEDIHNKVLDHMFKEFNGKVDDVDGPTKKTESENDESNNIVSMRPTNWFFPGWSCLLLFGPTAPRNQRVHLLCTKEDKVSGNTKKNGRNAAQKKEIEEKNLARSYDIDGNRGKTIGDRVNMSIV